LGVELIFAIERAITVIHNATSLSLAFFETVMPTEVVANLVCKRSPSIAAVP
jgi:hypothetical protein